MRLPRYAEGTQYPYAGYQPAGRGTADTGGRDAMSGYWNEPATAGADRGAQSTGANSAMNMFSNVYPQRSTGLPTLGAQPAPNPPVDPVTSNPPFNLNDFIRPAMPINLPGITQWAQGLASGASGGAAGNGPTPYLNPGMQWQQGSGGFGPGMGEDPYAQWRGTYAAPPQGQNAPYIPPGWTPPGGTSPGTGGGGPVINLPGGGTVQLPQLPGGMTWPPGTGGTGSAGNPAQGTSGGLQSGAGGQGGYGLPSYGPAAYQQAINMVNAPQQYANDQGTYIPALGATLPSLNSLNYGRLLDLYNSGGGDFASSLWGAGNRDFAREMAIARMRAPVGSAVYSNLVSTGL